MTTQAATTCTTGTAGCHSSIVSSDDQGPSLRVAIWVLVALSFLFLATRLYCKFLRHRTLHLDDYVLFASWLMLVGGTICVTIDIGYGFGKHASGINFANIDIVALTGEISITVSICAQAWSKTSWAITLLRISTGSIRGFMWFALISMNLFFAGPAIGWWLQCQPIEKAWHPLVPGTCWSPEIGVILGIVASCYSGIMDLTFAIIPWILLRNLHVSPAEKLGIALAMSMGVFAAIAAFLKASAMPTLTSPDFSYDGTGLTIWGSVEASVTIMAASVPMMRVLVQTVRRRKSWNESGDHLPGEAAMPGDSEPATAMTQR